MLDVGFGCGNGGVAVGLACDCVVLCLIGGVFLTLVVLIDACFAVAGGCVTC